MATWGSAAWGNATAAPRKSAWGEATTPAWGSGIMNNPTALGAVMPKPVKAMPAGARPEVSQIVNPFGGRSAGQVTGTAGMFAPPTPKDSGYSVDANQPGFLDKPGTGEQWYAANQNQINKSGDLGNFINGATGRLMGMDYQPSNSTGAFGQMQKELGGGPQQGTSNAWGVASQLRNPTAGEGVMQTAAGMFAGPNLAHNYATDTAGYFKSPTNTQGYADSLRGQFGPGQGQTGALAASGQLTNGGPGAAETNLAATDRALGGIHYGDEAIDFDANHLTNNTAGYADALGGFAQTRGTTGTEANKFLPGLENPSNSEQLYASGNEGLNFAYDRSLKQRTRELQDRMAAAGLFGSGATARGMEELSADTIANQARDMASLAGQADQAHLGRAGAAQSFSTAADADALSRARLGLEGYQAGDQQQAANVGLMNNVFGLASGEGLQKVGLRTTSANNAQQAMIDRLFKGGSLGIDADRAGNERTRLGLDVNSAADTQGLNRMLGGSTVAAAGDQSLFDQGTRLGNIGHQMTADEISRLDTSARAGVSGDVTNADRLQKLVAAGVDVDKLKGEAAKIGISVEDLIGKLTEQNDRNEWQRTKDREGMAVDVQNLFQGRYGTQFDQLMRLGGAKAGVDQTNSNASAEETYKTTVAQIQQLVDSGKLTAQQGQQMMDDLGQALGIGLKAFGK